MEQGERRLGAVMFTDVVGYSALASSDEQRALRLLEEHRRLLRPVIKKRGGVEVKTIGDAFLVEFGSAVEAVECAVEMQRTMGGFSGERAPQDAVKIRIGIHVGDVVHREGDVLGDAVNVAARVEPLADPGGICITRQVVDQVQRKVSHRMESVGMRELKNIGYPVEVFRVALEGESRGAGVGLNSKRVAILPFANMSSDPNDRYFADGMTEELISTVSKIGELQVISRTSVMRYRETTAPISQIGRELSAGSILEGSVRKAGNKVRITTQLIQAEDDRHLWSQSYDRDLTDVFAIQADIAEQVAGSLKVHLLAREKDSIRKEATSNTDAYTLYLKGRYYWGERTEANTRKALKYFEEAVKVDPGFAMAYSGIADAYSILSDYGWMPPQEALPLAKANAARALELDGSLAEAHASMGLVLSNFDWDLEGADRELARAIELKPNYTPALHWRSVDLFYMRKYDEAISLDERALALDPYSRLLNMTSANEKLVVKRYDEALASYDEMIKANPDLSALRYWRSICYILMGRYEEAVGEAVAYEKMEGSTATSYFALHRAWALSEAGRSKEAEALVQRAIEEFDRRPVSPTNVGWVLLSLGRMEEGYSWLEKGFAEQDPSLLYFNGFPWTRKFRDDPRWKAIEARFPFKSAAD